MPIERQGQWQYSAFISYNSGDQKWATWLHRSLETFRVPKRLIGRPTRFGALGPRLGPIFRDRDELATSHDLAASVQEALACSATLIVLCSPRAAKSRWVNEEVRAFIRMGREEHIRCIIVEGEPRSGDPALECLPEAIRKELAVEPLAADARPNQDGKRGALLKLVAGLIEVPFDELRQRDATRRHRRLTALLAVASFTILLTSSLAVIAWLSRNEAIAQRDLARKRTITTERTLGFVKDMFRVADPSEARGETITAREVVDRGARLLDKGLEKEPSVRAELGVTLAEVYGALGLYRRSDALVRQSMAIPDADRITRVRQWLAMADSHARLSKYEQASAAYRRALSALQDDDPDELRGRLYAGLAQSESALDRFEQADAAGRAALTIDLRRQGPYGSDTARDLETIGLNQFFAGNLDRAEPFIRRALAARLRSEGPASPSVADNRNTLGNIAQQRGKRELAERYFREAAESYEAVLGPDHPDLGTVLNNLGRVLIEQRKFARSAPIMDRAVALALPEKGALHDDMAFLFANRGLAQLGLGRLPAAESDLGRALAAALIHGHRMRGPVLADLAFVACRSGRFEEARAKLTQAREFMMADYPQDTWRLAWVQNVGGECALLQGDRANGRREIASSSPTILERWPPDTLFGYEAARRQRLTLLPAS